MKHLRSCLLSFAIFLPSALEAQVVYNATPSRIFGQAIQQPPNALTAIAPNLVEGRELWNPQALAVDTSANPPVLYVADTNNNRVMAWKNAQGFTKGDFADKVIGQRDFYTTSAKGPGTDLTTGLSAPTGVAVDKSGNLYVADAGNNRILRYPTPLVQTGQLTTPDIVIGQKDLNGKTANQGLGAASELTLALVSGSNPFRVGLAFDAQGNLWVSDAGNNRVLRYPSASLTTGTNQPAADVVLGQVDFVSNKLPSTLAQNAKNYIDAPAGLAFDPQGRLYVADQVARVLVFTPPFATAQSAARLMGVVIPVQGQPAPAAVSESTLGNTANPPESIFFIGNNPFVIDRGNARILKYDPFDQWPLESTQFSPKAIAVIGQPGYTQSMSNLGLPQPTASTFSGPVGAKTIYEQSGVVAAAVAGTDVYVVDSGNNRVLVFPISNGNISSATRLVGQIDFQYNSPNLIEGRELFLQGLGGAAAVDRNSNPPHLYVSDPGNNRVLGFLDYRKLKPGATADLVIGQTDFYSALYNSPKNDPNTPTNTGLVQPEGLVVDQNGDLYIADTGNGRVVRYPSPFTQPPGTVQSANLVLGQANLFSKIPDASQQTMRAPYGVGLSPDNHLLVSDATLNRILDFIRPQGGDFVNGQSAANVIGQPNYGPSTETTLSSPRLLSVDVDGKLYVADTGNSRIAIFRNVTTAGLDPQPSFSLPGLHSPYGVFVSQDTLEIWVADTSGSNLLRYPRYDTLVTNPVSNLTIPSPGPAAVTLDPSANPIVVESINRVSLYYPAIDYTGAAGGVPGRFSGNGASYFQRFSPGMLASIFAFQNTHFGLTTASASSVPLPTTLGDVQVIVNGVAAPLIYVSPAQINFQVPSSTPVTSVGVTFEVVQPSTGQILATWTFPIVPSSPGLFTVDSSGTGQLLALNQDNTLNSATNPAKAGSIIQLFGTGPGLVSGQPPDGTPATGAIATDQKPRVIINGTLLADADVQFSGLAPNFIGLWQVNAKVPTTVPTSNISVPVQVEYNGIVSSLDQFGNRRATTIRTTP